MGSKPLPVPAERLLALAREHGTPLFVYDAATIRARCAELTARFDVVRYAQKANSNLAILAAVATAFGLDRRRLPLVPHTLVIGIQHRLNAAVEHVLAHGGQRIHSLFSSVCAATV